MDKRRGTIKNTEFTKITNRRSYKINPDIIAQWQYLPFKNESFDMVIFDPPHYIEDNGRSLSNLHLKYGFINKAEYKQILKKGTKELFRVLKPEGTFIFKWSEVSKLGDINKILKLFPYQPLFGSRVGQKNKIHWIVFIKYDVNRKLEL